jgi:hypothetical protein
MTCQLSSCGLFGGLVLGGKGCMMRKAVYKLIAEGVEWLCFGHQDDFVHEATNQ